MGMFDTVYSSYNLGKEFTNIELQTKSLNCFLDNYWISPNRELFIFQYDKCYKMVKSKTNYFGFDWEKTGENGVIKPYYYTGGLEAYHKLDRILMTFWNGRITMWTVLSSPNGL